MAENYDVASRLAQGRPAVDTVQRYVWACHQLGYQHQDLTLTQSQVFDGYTTEDGMDLAALQQGCLALDAAVRSSHEALAIQDRQLAEFPAVWQGAGGHAAREFLRRHGDASATVAAAVKTAAEALSALREELWQAVGAKVDAVVAIEGRMAAERAEWSAASETVTTGAGDRAAASELVDQAVKPFVDTTIGTEWLAAMRMAADSVSTAYERAVAEIDAEPAPVFGVPGDFGPPCPPAAPACTSVEKECDEPRSSPAAAPAPPAAAPTPTAPTPTPAAPAPTAPAAAWTAPPAEPVAPPTAPPQMPPLGAMGSGFPDLGGGLSGLGQQFADTLGGLLGGEVPESPDLELEEPEPEVDEDLEDEPPAEEEPPVEAVIETGDAVPVEAEEPCEPAPEPPPPPPPAEPLPPAEPVGAESTPCEIAAGEVPQVGEPSSSPE